MDFADSAPDLEKAARVARVRERMASRGLSALLVGAIPDYQYLVGYRTMFPGETYVLVTGKDVFVFTDFCYREDVLEHCPETTFVEIPWRGGFDELMQRIKRLGGPLGVEGDGFTASFVEALRAEIGDRLVLTDGLVACDRPVKSSFEIAAVRSAAEMLVALFKHLGEDVKFVGRTTLDVATEIDRWLRQQGSGPMPFPPFVAAGAFGSRPHYSPSIEHRIEGDTFVLVDVGTTVDGYAADMTRMISTGRLTDHMRQNFEVAVEAQALGRSLIKPGAVCGEVDRRVRQWLLERPDGDSFQHILGHGVGLFIHEAPILGPDIPDVLEPGMCHTVEPGMYVAGEFGTRVEDTVLVTDHGYEVLTPFPYDPIEVG